MRAYMKTVKGRGDGKPAAWTLAAHLNLVKGLFTYAVKHRIVKSDYNPTTAMDAIDTNTTAEPEVMTCDEVKRMLVWCAQSESWHDLLPSVVLGVLCGIRAIDPKEINSFSFISSLITPFSSFNNPVSKSLKVISFFCIEVISSSFSRSI